MAVHVRLAGARRARGAGLLLGARSAGRQRRQAAPRRRHPARPGDGRAPEFPEPTITQYKPRTTLKTAQHPVPKAKFPVIDIHSHQPAPISGRRSSRRWSQGDGREQPAGAGERQRHDGRSRWRRPSRRSRPAASRAAWCSSPTSTSATSVPAGARRPPRSSRPTSRPARSASARSRRRFGLRIRKADGTRLKIDDPELDPVWDAAARLGMPVLIHTAEPQEFFEPIDFQNERWLELALYPRSPVSGRRVPARSRS